MSFETYRTPTDNNNIILNLYELKDQQLLVQFLFKITTQFYFLVLLATNVVIVFLFVLFKSKALYMVYEVLFDTFICLFVFLLYRVNNIKVVLLICLYLLGLNILSSMHDTLCEKKKINHNTRFLFNTLFCFYGLLFLFVFFANTKQDIILPALVVYYVILIKSLRYNLFYLDFMNEKILYESNTLKVENVQKYVLFKNFANQLAKKIQTYKLYSFILKACFVATVFVVYII